MKSEDAPQRRADALGQRSIGRRQLLGGAFAVAGGLALAACGSGSPGTAASATATSWTDILAAAKKEGQVNVSGTAGPAKAVLVDAFQKAYGIKVNLLSGNTGEMMTRWANELEAGQHTMDLSVAGTDSILEMFNNSWLQPLKPHLAAPGVTADWKPGKPWFRDPKGDTVLQVFNTISPNIHVNSKLVPPSALTSAQDLLDPAYTGKICAYNPGTSGPGNKAGFAIVKAKGQDFAEKLYLGQKVTLTRDYSQVARWLASGAYPIGLGVSYSYMAPYIQSGVKLQTVSLSDVQDCTGSGYGNVVMWNSAPHPNAAVVYSNWIAGQAGLAAYARNQYADPVRSDIKVTWIPQDYQPQPGVSYIDYGNFEITAQIADTTKWFAGVLQK